jgi:hypothetical protein
MKRLAIAAIAILALMPQAHAGALIANCTLKSNAMVKTMPASGDEHVLSGPTETETAVEVYDEYRGQWAYIESHDKDDSRGITGGWVPRSSLSNCENIKPWKK